MISPVTVYLITIYQQKQKCPRLYILCDEPKFDVHIFKYKLKGCRCIIGEKLQSMKDTSLQECKTRALLI